MQNFTRESEREIEDRAEVESNSKAPKKDSKEEG